MLRVQAVRLARPALHQARGMASASQVAGRGAEGPGVQAPLPLLPQAPAALPAAPPSLPLPGPTRHSRRHCWCHAARSIPSHRQRTRSNTHTLFPWRPHLLPWDAPPLLPSFSPSSSCPTCRTTTQRWSRCFSEKSWSCTTRSTTRWALALPQRQAQQRRRLPAAALARRAQLAQFVRLCGRA